MYVSFVIACGFCTRSSKTSDAPGREEEEEAEEEEAEPEERAKRLVPSDDVFEPSERPVRCDAMRSFSRVVSWSSTSLWKRRAHATRTPCPSCSRCFTSFTEAHTRQKIFASSGFTFTTTRPEGGMCACGAARPGRSVPPFPSNLQKRRGRPPRHPLVPESA